MYGGWIMIIYITVRWTWMGAERHIWLRSTNGYKEHKAVRDLSAFRVIITNLDNGEYVTSVYLPKL